MLGDRAGPRGEAAFANAVGFIRHNLNAEGGLGLADDVADYPTYATALALRGAARRKPAIFDTSRMISWLENRQFAEHSGWTVPTPPTVAGASERRSSPRRTRVTSTCR